MLHAKYGCSSLYGLSQIDFQRFTYLFLCKIGCARTEPKYDRRGIILTILAEDHQIMLHTKYEISSHNGFSEEDFLKIFFFVSM